MLQLYKTNSMLREQVWLKIIVKIVTNSLKWLKGWGLFSDDVGVWRCSWYRLLLSAMYGFYVQVIVPGGKNYFYIRAG